MPRNRWGISRSICFLNFLLTLMIFTEVKQFVQVFQRLTSASVSLKLTFSGCEELINKLFRSFTFKTYVFILCAWVFYLHTCAPCLAVEKARVGFWFSGTGCERPCGCWELTQFSWKSKQCSLWISHLSSCIFKKLCVYVGVSAWVQLLLEAKGIGYPGAEVTGQQLCFVQLQMLN